MSIISPDNTTPHHSPSWSCWHRHSVTVPPPFMSWIITPRVCSARLRWETAHLHNFFSNSPTFTSPFVVLSHAPVTERRRVALMGGINKLVKLPISNQRSAWQRRAVPAGNRFSPVHQRSHEPRGSSCVPKCPQLLLNSLWLTVSRGGFRISEHQGLGSDPPPPRREGGRVSALEATFLLW